MRLAEQTFTEVMLMCSIDLQQIQDNEQVDSWLTAA